MKLSALARYPAPASRVAVALADSRFLEAWLAADQATGATATVAGSPPGPFTVSIRRTVPVHDLPAQFRHLLPRGLEVRQVNVWDLADTTGRRQGTVAVDIVGAPLKLAGTVTLIPRGDQECEQRYTIDLGSTIPIVGARIEQAAAEVIQHSLDVERTTMLTYLACDGVAPA
jgi:uncharacterized protein YndB with AHSA1/START domain